VPTLIDAGLILDSKFEYLRLNNIKLFMQLNFGGNCAEAFHYYEQHLGGKIPALIKRSEIPGDTQNSASEEDPVVHARILIGQTTLIGNDVPPDRFQRIRSAYLYLALDSAQEAERIYGLLATGGEVYMPLQETFFASRFSQFRDRCGASWTLIHEQPTS
jgi:PhnB protein